MSNTINPIDSIIDYLKAERERRVKAYNSGKFCDNELLSKNIETLTKGIAAMTNKKQGIDYKYYAISFARELQKIERNSDEINLDTIELIRKFKIKLGISIPESLEEGTGSLI